MISWARIRCDIRTYLSTVYSTATAGLEQIVCISHRDLLEAARKRFAPFVPSLASALAASNARSRTKDSSDLAAMAAFFIARGRGLTVAEALYWSNRPDDALLLNGPGSPTFLTKAAVVQGKTVASLSGPLPYEGPHTESSSDVAGSGAGLEEVSVWWRW